MTDAELHAHVTDLFLEALAVPDAERDAWLHESVSDPDIRERVHALLANHTPTGLLDEPAFVRAPEDLGVEASGDPFLGQTVGPWHVVDLLGRGGMGTVYRAERHDESFDQSVALKLVRPGFGEHFRARFVRERALLASLDHPGIARLLDGGVASGGTPYLAIELVDGTPITTYADARGLDIEARLRLFVLACDAVAYAHRNLVVHRDLKPDHIVVEAVDEETRVKLLDFGVAKLLSDDDDVLTRTGSAGPLTPAYASPEQLRGSPITTATDVYALGLVLYEVLTGRRPYSLSGLTLVQADRVVSETIPPLASEVAPPEARRALRGDLDTIAAKALEKEPNRRYATAADLAADIRRYLDGLPVEARPATAAYRTARFLKRHRVLASAVAT
ncbi:MAG: serine/threonine-protein kinase, partial [Bacteroidota bacterium]